MFKKTGSGRQLLHTECRLNVSHLLAVSMAALSMFGGGKEGGGESAFTSHSCLSLASSCSGKPNAGMRFLSFSYLLYIYRVFG